MSSVIKKLPHFNCPFVPIKQLGEGSFGKVVAVQTVSGEVHAVKYWRDKVIDTHEIRAYHALQSTADSKHPGEQHVMRCLGLGSGFLVLEPVLFRNESVTLSSFTRRTPLASEHIQMFARHLIWGLDRLYAASVLHTDLHPGNFLMGEDHLGKPRLVIQDFGYSAVLPAPHASIDTRDVQGYKESWGMYAVENFGPLGSVRNWQSVLLPGAKILAFMHDPEKSYCKDDWQKIAAPNILNLYHQMLHGKGHDRPASLLKFL